MDTEGLAAAVGLPPVQDESPSALRRRIDAELRELQSAPDHDLDRYRNFVEARVKLGQQPETTTELVQMPSALLEQMVVALSKSAESAAKPAPAPGSKPERKMQKSKLVAKTAATSDFRHSRSWPTAGISAIAAAAWASREALGVQLTPVSELTWGAGAGGVIVCAIYWYALSRSSQTRAERRLNSLYSPDTQETALVLMYRDLENNPQKNRVDDRWLFHRWEYAEALAEHARIRHSDRRATFTLHTIDFDAALQDATDLALARLIELNMVEPVVTPIGQLFGQKHLEAQAD